MVMQRYKLMAYGDLLKQTEPGFWSHSLKKLNPTVTATQLFGLKRDRRLKSNNGMEPEWITVKQNYGHINQLLLDIC